MPCPHPHQLLPLGPLILPACSGLVCTEWMAIRTQRESWKVCACVCVCCVQKQGGADSCGLWAVRGFCVRVGLREEEPPSPPHPHNNLDGLPGVYTADQTGCKSCRGSTTLNNAARAAGRENNEDAHECKDRCRGWRKPEHRGNTRAGIHPPQKKKQNGWRFLSVILCIWCTQIWYLFLN